ncbi:MAG: stage III sporulation protein AB [Heliobacteriaceae bacterium]|nr:stage III sporulation protein AB [Heliobacteriaceae bacterium]MDD4587201.1 stage III sporulation protein AB [Heliobacteriaceae bacterium]
MLKILGALLVLGACGLLGWLRAKDLHSRPRQLAGLQGALGLLATEIGYGSTPLPQAMANVSQGVASPVDRLFCQVAEKLARSQGDPAAAVWRDCLTTWLPGSALHPSDGEELGRLALGLGEAPRDDQLLRIHEIKNRLAGREEAARDQCQKLARVWSYGGVLTGLLIILLVW